MIRGQIHQKVMLPKLIIMIQINSQSDNGGFSDLTWKKFDGDVL